MTVIREGKGNDILEQKEFPRVNKIRQTAAFGLVWCCQHSIFATATRHMSDQNNFKSQMKYALW
jgi:hypothetical protein